MTMVPFSSEHLSLLDTLPEETGPRRQAAGLFVEVGQPRLVCVARQAARRRRGWRQPLEVADALSLAHIYVRILEGRYSALPGDTLKRDRIEADIDNCVRSHVRRELSHRRRFAPLGDHTERLVSDSSLAWKAVARQERIAVECTSIRDLPVGAVDRLLLMLFIHPARVERIDVEAAAAASRVVVRRGRARVEGITRPVDETLDRIAAWLQAPVPEAVRRSARRMRGRERRFVAWILRGPCGATDPSWWRAAQQRQAENWLDHRRKRLLETLETSGLIPALDPACEGSGPVAAAHR